MFQCWDVAKCFNPSNIHLDSRRFTSLSKAFFSLSRHKGDRLQLFLHICMSLTGVNIWTLSLKLPMKIMMDMRWLSLSMRLNCIMKRSSSLRASRGFLSLSYCRRSFISASVGKNRIKHSTKSTRIVRRSKLQKRKSHEQLLNSCFVICSRVPSCYYYYDSNDKSRCTTVYLWRVSVISTRRGFFLSCNNVSVV